MRSRDSHDHAVKKSVMPKGVEHSTGKPPPPTGQAKHVKKSVMPKGVEHLRDARQSWAIYRTVCEEVSDAERR